MNWLRRIGFARPAARVAAVAPAYAADLAAIHAGAFARPWGPDEFEDFIADPAVQLDGLFLGRRREPQGFAVSRVTLDEAEILSVALARPARGLGHARALLAQHLGRLRLRGVAAVHLEVEEGNGPALSLYGRLGFEKTGLRPGYYLRPDGSRATALSMTRHLAPEPSR